MELVRGWIGVHVHVESGGIKKAGVAAGHLTGQRGQDAAAGGADRVAEGDARAVDVHPVEVARVASAYTPVPGGVGPLTIAMLMANTVALAELHQAG